MSIGGVALNLINKLSFNLNPRLVSLSRLKRSGVRCFTADSGNLGFPVRYIPKKCRDANKTQSSNSGDDSDEHIGLPTSSHSHICVHNTVSKRSNNGNQKCSDGVLRDPEQEFRNMRLRPLKETVEELQTNNDIVQGQLSHSNPEISYCNEGLDYESMEVPKESFQEMQVYKKGGQDRQCELNGEISFQDGSIDSEYMEASEEVDVEEGQIWEGVSQRGTGISKACRTRQDAEISYCNEGLDYESMEEPKESFQEMQVYKKAGQNKQCELNGEISFQDGSIDSEYMEASEEVDVEEGQIWEGVSQRGTGISKACRTRQDAEKFAVVLLAKRAFTAVELRKKLISKQFPVNIVQSVIHDFLDRGLINDSLYAETFSQSRWTSSSWGPRRIKHALVSKGVSEGDVKKAVKLVFEDGEDIDQNTNIRLSNSTVEKLYLQASKQWRRSQNAPYETRKGRVIRWLQYRGFDWSVIGIILKKLESNHPP